MNDDDTSRIFKIYIHMQYTRLARTRCNVNICEDDLIRLLEERLIGLHSVQWRSH